jgi:hypothetical protein
MAQTTVQVSSVDAKVEIGVNGSAWTDVSGSANKVDIGPQDRAVGNAFTFDGDASVLTYGKLQPIDVTLTVIYTETDTTEAFEVLRGYHETENGQTVYLRWTPLSETVTAGHNIYSTGSARLKSFQYPSVDAASGDPIICTATFTAAKITVTVSVTA